MTVFITLSECNSVRTVTFPGGDLQESVTGGIARWWVGYSIFMPTLVMDSRTVDILHECPGGRRFRLIRRAESSGVLILEVTEQNSEGRHFARRLVMDKQ